MVKTYKITNNCGIEDLGSGGNWNSFLKINRSDFAGQGSGTIQKVRLTYLNDDQVDSASQSGVIFVASTSDNLSNTTPALNDEYIMASSAGRLMGGVLTLNLDNYKIRDNVKDTNRKDGPIWLFAKTTDLGATDNVELFVIAETHGRWLETTTINP